ncbi:MAG: peptidase MA family metallohydrolase [Syntrophorhabdus sp.]
MTLIASFHFFLVIVLLLLTFAPAYSDNLASIQDNDVIIRFDEPLKNTAREVVGLYPRIKKELEGTLEWQIAFKPSILLIRENTTFQEIIANPYIIAFADSRKNLIVVDYSKMNASPFTLEVTLKHEMCHLLLGSNIPDDRLPRWLNEGFCQWVTGGIGELMVGDRQPNLNKASLSHRLIPLASLSRSFPVERDQLILAYEESKSIVEYMVAEYGQGNVMNIINYLKDGDSIDEAIRRALSMSLDELEKRWILHLQKRITWAGYVATNIYTILLFAAAMLTICGFLRIIIRKRHRASKTDEDEEEIGVN